MKTTHTEFERYYQQVRSRQKRDAVCWSLLLLALYFAAGSAAEFNLLTIWHSLPHFFDYMAETIPPLSAGNLFADVQTKGSLAWWGYRLPIQLPLIWETLQLALASTLVAVAIATVFAFLAANNAWSPAPVRFAIRVLVAFLRTMPELAWAVIFVMAFGIGAIPGFLALMLHTVGSLTKLFYEAVESAQNKPVRGLAACGASPLQKIRFALWPQVKPLFLSQIHSVVSGVPTTMASFTSLPRYTSTMSPFWNLICSAFLPRCWGSGRIEEKSARRAGARFL